ncbi:MAG: winged helix-turn-helix domain-containing protein [Hyphomonadaceae bacterium]
MTLEPPPMLRAGPFSIDRDRMRVTRGPAVIALSGKPLQILLALVKAGGRVVTREELRLLLWPEAGRIDTGRRLNTAIRALREALDDGAETPLFIETVRRRGYRWIGDAAAPRVGRLAAVRPVAAALSAVAAALLVGSAQLGAAPSAAADRERLVDIAALANNQPDAAAAALNQFVETRPRDAAAQVLRAELAMNSWRARPSAERRAAARSASREARRALGRNADLDAIDADLTLTGDWDWRGAERLYRRALAAAPDHERARTGLAWLLLNAGRETEAFAVAAPLVTRADLEPASRAQLGWFLLRLRRNDLAARVCAGDAHHVNLLSCRHTALARLGDYVGARDAALTLMQRLNAGRRDLAEVRAANAGAGYQNFLRWRAEHFSVSEAQHFQRAQIAADAGRLDEAMAQLDQAFTARDPALVKLRTTYEFAALHQWPRFAEMLRTIGPA